jgi:hypothetical protein
MLLGVDEFSNYMVIGHFFHTLRHGDDLRWILFMMSEFSQLVVSKATFETLAFANTIRLGLIAPEFH